MPEAEQKHPRDVGEQHAHDGRQNLIALRTESDAAVQLGVFHLPDGEVIVPHAHIPCERVLTQTSEVLVIQEGRLHVDFYRKDRTILSNAVVAAGDILILLHGGHGFRALEPVRMLEVKQGPYMGERDKVRFDADAAS